MSVGRSSCRWPAARDVSQAPHHTPASGPGGLVPRTAAASAPTTDSSGSWPFTGKPRSALFSTPRVNGHQRPRHPERVINYGLSRGVVQILGCLGCRRGSLGCRTRSRPRRSADRSCRRITSVSRSEHSTARREGRAVPTASSAPGRATDPVEDAAFTPASTSWRRRPAGSARVPPRRGGEGPVDPGQRSRRHREDGAGVVLGSPGWAPGRTVVWVSLRDATIGPGAFWHLS